MEIPEVREDVKNYFEKVEKISEESVRNNKMFDPIDIGVDLNDCYRGTPDIISCGDIAEYISDNNSYYGLVNGDCSILLYSVSGRRMKIQEKKDDMGNLYLKNIWINTF